MKILVITDVLWRNDNGVGNSYSNIFKGLDNIEIANICCQEGRSDNEISQGCFQISENRLIKNLINKKIPSGIIEDKTHTEEETTSGGRSGGFVSALRRSRLQVLFWARNLIWNCGRWKSPELRNFIDEFSPDMIFAQLQDKIYLNNLVKYVQEYLNKPLVLYAWDDVYSLKQFSLSPLYWIDRFAQRASIRKIVKKCEILYTISAEQKKEYEKSLNKRTELLFKGKDFACPPKNTAIGKPLKILYTGNLYSGRFDTIYSLAQKLDELNKTERKAELYIYSATELSKRQEENIKASDSTFFMGKVSEQEVQVLQKEADVLLHIEPMSLKGSLLCRLSFSTKLVDYFYNAKCIFAVGSKRCSSIKYLKRYDAAFISETLTEADAELARLVEKPDLVKEYSEKAWRCGKENHQIKDIQTKLLKHFNEII